MLQLCKNGRFERVDGGDDNVFGASIGDGHEAGGFSWFGVVGWLSTKEERVLGVKNGGAGGKDAVARGNGAIAGDGGGRDGGDKDVEVAIVVAAVAVECAVVVVVHAIFLFSSPLEQASKTWLPLEEGMHNASGSFVRPEYKSVDVENVDKSGGGEFCGNCVGVDGIGNPNPDIPFLVKFV